MSEPHQPNSDCIEVVHIDALVTLALKRANIPNLIQILRLSLCIDLRSSH